MEEKITIEAKRRKDVKDLMSLFGDLGFSKISYSSGVLSVEKNKGADLDGKPQLDYRVELKSDAIELSFYIPKGRSRMSRLLEVMPLFLNILEISEEFFDIKTGSVFQIINTSLAEIGKIIDKDALEFSTQLSDTSDKYNDLKTKYDDLVRSSEASTRLLLDCEQKNEELTKTVEKLSAISDELLMENVYNWIKIHGGSIDIREFAKANSMPPARVEEGLNMLIRDGYIKRRSQ